MLIVLEKKLIILLSYKTFLNQYLKVEVFFGFNQDKTIDDKIISILASD